MPMPSNNSLSPASSALGFNTSGNAGQQLVQQRDEELEENRRKKLLGAGASPAILSLFGMRTM